MLHLTLLALAAAGSTAAASDAAAAAPAPVAAPPLGRPRFSWNTLPVFFHSANASGPWSPAAAKAIAKYAMATNEKNHAMLLPDGKRQSEELAGPVACRQIAKEGTGTATFFYLNSVIDWPFNFKLHGDMVKTPAWREKTATGGDIGPTLPGSNWMYALEVPEMKAAWVKTCVDAVRAGCTGCFIDQATAGPGWARAGGATKEAAAKYGAGHLAALIELSHELASTGNYPILNHFGVNGSRAQGMSNPSAMMIEDFTGSELCVKRLQTIAERGFTVQAHAGNSPKGNQCVDGDINAMAAFLVAAGDYSYYHCSFTNGQGGSAWGSAKSWPAVPDSWLDWCVLFYFLLLFLLLSYCFFYFLRIFFYFIRSQAAWVRLPTR